MTATTSYSVKSRIILVKKKKGGIFYGKNQVIFRSYGIVFCRLSISFFMIIKVAPFKTSSKFF